MGERQGACHTTLQPRGSKRSARGFIPQRRPPDRTPHNGTFERKELERFAEFDAYDDVSDEGQKVIGTTWVLTEKVKHGETCVKARLVVRGDQEETDDIQTDSPTVR